MIARNICDRAVLPFHHAPEVNLQLKHRVARLIGSAENKSTAIPRLTLHQWHAPTGPVPVIYEPSVTVLAQGRGEVHLGTATLTFDSSHYLLTSIALPAVARVVEARKDAPCLAVSLKLDMTIVREFLGREDLPLPDTTTGCPAMSIVPTAADFLSPFCRLLDLLSHPGDIPFLGGLLEREIVYRILARPEGSRLRAIVTPGGKSHQTAKAIASIRANYERPLRVEELAELAGMAISTLHHHFRAITAMGPLQYQKQIRLQAARARLLDDDVSAATVAFEVGYKSAPQFNREYTRLFGEPPLPDIRKLRLASAS